MIIIACTVAGVFLLWAAWWVYRGTPKHRTTIPPAVAAHHPLPDPGAPTEAWTMPARHATRDPLTGRFVRREL